MTNRCTTAWCGRDVTHVASMLLLAGATLVACGGSPAGPAHPTGPAHWSYEGATGPEHWAEIDPTYAACGTGRRQSPIDITAPFETGTQDLTTSYVPSSARVVNNGHTIQVNLTGESTLVAGGTTYHLVQFHFHTPSEEAIAGKRHDLVVHLVHMTDTRDLAVVAVLLDVGAENQALAPVFASLPGKEGEEVALDKPFDPAALLPPSLAHYRFDGSLTTPPCSEGVRWFVLETPGSLSSDALARFKAIFPGNARPLQPRHDRRVQTAE